MSAPQDPAPPVVQPSFTPLTGMQVGPDGSVTYDFEGHVSADGIDLQSSPIFGGTPPADRKVRWSSEANGALVAEIAGYEQLGNRAYMRAGNDIANSGSASIDVGSFAFGSQPVSHTVNAYAGSKFANVLSSSGFSGFLRYVRGASGWLSTPGLPQVHPWGANIGTTFNLPEPTTCLIGMQCSAYMNFAVGRGWWQLMVDGVAIATAGHFFNQTGVHQLMSWCIAQVTLGAGNHTLSASNPSPLAVDGEDTCSWFVVG